MEHLALYREQRPQLFREVIGQEHVCRTLQNAVRQGRVAHAYLFCGPRGTGKTSTARILAKAVNCPNSEDGEPCNICTSCRSTTAGISMDVIEMDAASHRGIDEIRDLNQKVCFVPTAGKSRLFIIDEVHMLTGEAFNALLKTLEEPPRHTIFVLATTEAHKVPLTIMSRCQRFDFRRLGRDVINDHLRRVAGEKGWQIDDDALELLSRHACGALRDALGLLEQAASFTGGAISRADLETLTGAISPEGLRSLLAAAMAGDVSSLLQQLDELSAGGCEPRQVLFQLIDLVRDRLFAAATPGPERTGYANLLRGMAAAEADMKGNSRPDLMLELALVRLSDAFAIPAPGDTGSAPAAAAPAKAIAPASVRQPGMSEPVEAPQAAVSKSATAATGEGAAGKTAGAAAGQPSPQEQAPAAVPLGELRKILGRAFQKRPLAAQALASCNLSQDGDRIVLKASSAFHQEMLLKDENRRSLQDAIKERHPALELEIVSDVRSQRSEKDKEDYLGRPSGSLKDEIQEKNPTSDLRHPASVSGQAPDVVEEPHIEKREAPTLADAEQEGIGEANNNKDLTSHLSHPTSRNGQVDPLVGVALTLFNGKIIDETEAG